MGVPALKEALPAYAKDIRLNLDSTIAVSTLPTQRLWGTVLATAIASRGRRVLVELAEEARQHLSGEAFDAAKAAAAVMAMNNIYYRFVHLASNKEYATMPARLRMNVIGNPGVDKADFELWSLAVSAINGCGACIDAHEKTLHEAGVASASIQTAVRFAAIIQSVAVAIEAGVGGLPQAAE